MMRSRDRTCEHSKIRRNSRQQHCRFQCPRSIAAQYAGSNHQSFRQAALRSRGILVSRFSMSSDSQPALRYSADRPNAPPSEDLLGRILSRSGSPVTFVRGVAPIRWLLQFLVTGAVAKPRSRNACFGICVHRTRVIQYSISTHGSFQVTVISLHHFWASWIHCWEQGERANHLPTLLDYSGRTRCA